MLSLLLLALPALAAPPGFESIGQSEDCALFLGPDGPDDVVPMWAECTWRDVSFTAIDRLLSAPERASTVWKSVVGVRLMGVAGDTRRVWQQHALIAMPDREVVIDWKRRVVPDGARYEWANVDVDWALLAGNERCPRYDGFWEVKAHPGGGAHVTHATWYDPGSFPTWLQRPFLGGELAQIVGQLHTAARALP